MKQPKPLLKAGVSGGRVLARRQVSAKTAGKIFSRLVIVWLQSNGVPFNTTGFRARLIRQSTGQVVATTSFDRYGAARFSTISTLTQVRYRVQLLDNNGTVFRTRQIPAGVEVFGVIG
ncbi:hypothetical protein [Paenibacillus gansuensis]|uniref:Uncharacterized protein n=1 Tax=Paenibacillus gansuensis TaxID=306542 RepID=A0ABW5PLM7_9BACL